MTLPIPDVTPGPGVEFFVTFSARTADERPGLPKGHEIAWDQIAIPVPAGAWTTVDAASMPPLNVEETPASIAITGGDFSVVFDRATGTIGSWRYRSAEMVRTGPVPYFWRVPTDNDLGNKMPERLAVWREAGDKRSVGSVNLARTGPAQVEVTVRGAVAAGDSPFTTRYTVYGSGDLVVDHTMYPGQDGLPELPRFGMRLTLPAAFQTMTWFGRGPHESYADRKTSAAVGRYASTVADQYHPHIRPQEHGNKTDVRWVALTNSAGLGLLAAGLPLVSVAASHYVPEEYDRGRGEGQLRTVDMKRRDLVHLTIDLGQMGVGGDTSWGARTHAEYTLPARPYTLRYRLRPFSADAESPDALARQRF